MSRTTSAAWPRYYRGLRRPRIRLWRIHRRLIANGYKPLVVAEQPWEPLPLARLRSLGRFPRAAQANGLCPWVSTLLLGGFLISVFIAGCEKSPSPVEPMKDWSDIYLTVTGYTPLKGEERLSASQDAKQDAYARLEDQILRLKIDSKRNVGALLVKDETLKEKLKAFIRGAKVVSTEFLPDSNQISVTLELYLGNDFKTVLGLKEKSLQERKPPISTPEGSGIFRP